MSLDFWTCHFIQLLAYNDHGYVLESVSSRREMHRAINNGDKESAAALVGRRAADKPTTPWRPGGPHAFCLCGFLFRSLLSSSFSCTRRRPFRFPGALPGSFNCPNALLTVFQYFASTPFSLSPHRNQPSSASTVLLRHRIPPHSSQLFLSHGLLGQRN